MRILIAEDNPRTRLLLEAQLDLLGHETMAAGTGCKALLIVETCAAFDLIISDIQMRLVDGCPLLNSLKAIDPNLPVLITRRYQNQLAKPTLCGADGYLDKPFSFNDLQRAIASVVEPSLSLR